MEIELSQADKVLLKGIDSFVAQSKLEGIPRDRAKGEVDLLMEVACYLENPTMAAELKMRYIVGSRFDKAWPVAN